MKKAAFIALMTCSLAVAVHAEEKKKGGGGGFAKLDKDSSGSLTLEEFSVGKPDAAKAEARFKKLDTDQDKSVSKEKFAAGMKKKSGGDATKEKKAKEDSGEANAGSSEAGE